MGRMRHLERKKQADTWHALYCHIHFIVNCHSLAASSLCFRFVNSFAAVTYSVHCHLHPFLSRELFHFGCIITSSLHHGYQNHWLVVSHYSQNTLSVMKIWLYGPYSMYSTAHILRHLLDRKGEMCHFEFKSRHLQISHIDGLLHQLKSCPMAPRVWQCMMEKPIGCLGWWLSAAWHILGQTHAPEMPLRWYNIGPWWLAQARWSGQCISKPTRPVHIKYAEAQNLWYIWSVRCIFIYLLTHMINDFRL